MSVAPDSVAAGEIAAQVRPRAGLNRSYSRFVGLAKRILPGVAVVLLALVAIWPRLQAEMERVHFPVPRLDPREAQDLRMVNARYTGIDRQNRPFIVTAEVARQNPNIDDLVALEGPRGDLTSTSGAWFELNGYTGLYQPNAQLLDLFGDVQLFQDRGNEFHTDSAHIDMAGGNAEGNDPVEGQGPFGHITGQGFRIRDHGDIIIFTGHAHLILVPHEKEVP
ncbi:MAG: LPS export ABC transporter periplasmic protein LptC [Stellaceae bacterium]